MKQEQKQKNLKPTNQKKKKIQTEKNQKKTPPNKQIRNHTKRKCFFNYLPQHA